VQQFAAWLASTAPSVFIQEHNGWTIPVIQSVHIAGIALVMGSVLLIDLRILGWAGMDQTLRQTTSRFGPWLTGSLWLLLATGLLMVIGEPVRELVTFSFWLKMALVVIGITSTAVLGRSLLHTALGVGAQFSSGAKTGAVALIVLWLAIIFLGRFIAYDDEVWGSLSLHT